MDAGEQQATLQVCAGRVQVAAPAESAHALHGGAATGRFLIGSDDPAEIIQQEEIVCTGLAAELAEVLFPNMHPVMSHWDEY